MTPLVSIVSICYNHSAFVVENLDSILSQTYDNFELIIMDDASSDNSEEKINDWIRKSEVQCKFIAHRENQGVCKTMNEAIKLCKGKYISLIAADDVMASDKTEQQVEVLEKSGENIALCTSNFYEIDKNGKILKDKYFEDDFKFPNNAFDSMLLGKGVLIHSPTVMIKASVYDKVGLYKEDYIQEDLYMWLKVCQRYKVEYIAKPLVGYRILETSLSKSEIYRERMLKDRIKVLHSLITLENETSNQSIYSSIIQTSGSLVHYYSSKSEFSKIHNQISIQEKYYLKLLNKKKLIPFFENEITDLYISNSRFARKMIVQSIFKNISYRKRYLIRFLPNYFLKKYRKYR